MKKRTVATLWALAILTWTAPALAQPVNLPGGTVWGRTSIGTGPGQAIPFSVLSSQLSPLGSGGSLVGGPPSSTVGDLVTWGNTSGTLLADSGLRVSAVYIYLHAAAGGL